ncbi:MAG TPA: uroporphyrinogen-III synthase [Acidothermaceae bacterium]|nr:uroporphyrinogen-III synthase [Acidothermaceae bacterium]
MTCLPGVAAAPLGGIAAAPLVGYTVGVTAARRSEELTALLERRGARVVNAPAIRIVPLADDAELMAATSGCVSRPPDIVVVTTGIGFRGWMEAADGWGLGEPLRAGLAAAQVVARGPKARGAIRASGLREGWSPESESMTEVLQHLLAAGVAGRRVVVQLHGEPLSEFRETLAAAGADVVGVPVYRWAKPADVRPLQRLIESVAGCQLDAVVFTSAPAVTSLLQSSCEMGLEQQVLAALNGDVLAACVGPVCARPFDLRGVPAVWPERGRLGSLVREIVEQLPARRRPLKVNGRTLEVRGRGVMLDGAFVEIPPAPLAVLRALASRAGRVLSRSELLAALPGDSENAHVVEMAVSRLRNLTGEPNLVRTVVQRGYQVRLDP